MPGKRTMRYFFMNLVSILLPILVTSFAVTQLLIARVQEEEKEKLSMQLEEIGDSLSLNFQEFKEKAILLFENNEFDSRRVVLDPITARTAIRLLGNIKQFDNSVDAMTVYYGTGFLYYGNGRVSSNTFLSTTMLCDWSSTKVGIDALESEEPELNVLRKKNNDGYLMYHIPVKKDFSGNACSVQFYFGFSKLCKLIEGGLNNTDVLIELDLKGQKIYVYNKESGAEIVDSDELEKILHSYKKICSEEVLIEPEMTVRLLFDMEGQLEEFYSVRNVYMAFLVIGVCVSLLMSFHFSRKRQSFIDALIYNIKNKNTVKSNSSKSIISEFDYIQSVLNESIVESNELKVNAQRYRVELLKQISKMIFHGLLREQEEIKSVLQICGVELFEEYFCLYGIRVEKNQLEEIKNLIQAEIHYIKLEEEQIYAFILHELPNEDRDMIIRYEFAKHFQEMLDSVGIECRQVVMSRAYKQISMVNHGYLEVLSIIKHLPPEEKRSICFEEWSRNKHLLDAQYSDDDFNVLREAIRKKNEKKISGLLRQILQRTEQSSEEERRYVRFAIVQEFLLELRSSENDGENQQLISDILGIRLENNIEFEKEILHVVKVYCKESETSVEFSDILRFIKKNYTDLDFSLNMVSDYARLSKTQMSKLFKARMGMGYIEYVTLLRMEETKELLLQTDLSVKDIFSMVGYVDVTSASRKFKAYYGMNPSVYREQVKAQKEKSDIIK